MNAGSRGMTSRVPKATGKATRIMPRRQSTPRAASSALSNSATMSRALSRNFSLRLSTKPTAGTDSCRWRHSDVETHDHDYIDQYRLQWISLNPTRLVLAVEMKSNIYVEVTYALDTVEFTRCSTS